MKNRILYQQHIMWYESEMINETFDSLEQALNYNNIDNKLIDIVLCLNSQTYLEKPIKGKAFDMFDKFKNHNIMNKAKIIYKTDKDNFYNIGDWRREVYNENYKYTIWGESDCLIPQRYFFILLNLNIKEPHILSLSSRIMWDNSWNEVIHENLPKNINVNDKNLSHEEFKPFRYYDYINQKQLNDFNRKYNNIKVVLLSKNKLDGSLLALSSGLPNPFIAPKMNFVREDFCAQQFFTYKNIKQYNISNILKGHNYKHPLKRTNTRNTRNDEKFKKMERYNLEQMKIFINKIKNEE